MRYYVSFTGLTTTNTTRSLIKIHRCHFNYFDLFTGLTTTTTTHEPRPLSCRPLEFRCEDGEMCIFLEWRCDGSFQCTDKSDERNCGSAPTMSAGVLCAIIISSLTSAALLTFGIAYFYAKRGRRRLCCFRVRSDRWRSRRRAPEGINLFIDVLLRELSAFQVLDWFLSGDYRFYCIYR